MSMRREMWVMVSSSSHLTNLSVSDVGVAECRFFKIILSFLQLHNVHTKSHENQSSHSPVIEFVQMDIAGEEFKFG
jgi:hypothetical protein